MELEIIDIPLLQDFTFDVPSIIKRAKEANLVILASPNNPTGTALSIDAIEDIALEVRGMIVIDEAYFEFYKNTAQKLIAKFENLIITRTFSKAFGLAGIRLGYLLARPDIAKELEKAKLPFSVGIFQQIAGELAMQNYTYINDIVDNIIDERNRCYTVLKELEQINPIQSFTNFILFEIENYSARELFDRLYEKGVLVRHFETPRLRNMLRVTIGTAQENEIFLKKLKEILLS
jgi:histidinol-phosphate aminotransferase